MSDSHEPSRYLNAEWVAYLNDEGEEYYYNLYTAETTWDLPHIEPDKVKDTVDEETADPEPAAAEHVETEPTVGDLHTDSPAAQAESTQSAANPTAVEETTVPVDAHESPASAAVELVAEVAVAPEPEPQPTPEPTVTPEPAPAPTPAPIATQPEPVKQKPAKPPKAVKPASLAGSTKAVVAPVAQAVPAPSAPENISTETKPEAAAVSTAQPTEPEVAPPASVVVVEDKVEEHGDVPESADNTAEVQSSAVLSTEQVAEPAAATTAEATESAPTGAVAAAADSIAEEAPLPIDTTTVTTAATTETPALADPVVDTAPATQTNNTTTDTTNTTTNNNSNATDTTDTTDTNNTSTRSTKTTSTGKVSALAKMFSRPTSSNNITSGTTSPKGSGASGAGNTTPKGGASGSGGSGSSKWKTPTKANTTTPTTSTNTNTNTNRVLFMQPVSPKQQSIHNNDTTLHTLHCDSTSPTSNRNSRKFDKNVFRRLQSDDAENTELFDADGLLILPMVDSGGDTPPPVGDGSGVSDGGVGDSSTGEGVSSDAGGSAVGEGIVHIEVSSNGTSGTSGSNGDVGPVDSTNTAEANAPAVDSDGAGAAVVPVEPPVEVAAVEVVTVKERVKPPRPPPPPLPPVVDDGKTASTIPSSTVDSTSDSAGHSVGGDAAGGAGADVAVVVGAGDTVPESITAVPADVVPATTADGADTATMSTIAPTATTGTGAATTGAGAGAAVSTKVKPPKPPKKVTLKADTTTTTSTSAAIPVANSAVDSSARTNSDVATDVSVVSGGSSSSLKERPLPPLPSPGKPTITTTTTTTTTTTITTVPVAVSAAATDTATTSSEVVEPATAVTFNEETDAAPAWLTHQSTNITATVDISDNTNDTDAHEPNTTAAAEPQALAPLQDVDSDTEYGEIVSEPTTPHTPTTPTTPAHTMHAIHSTNSSNSNMSELTASPVPVVDEGSGECASDRTPQVQVTLHAHNTHTTHTTHTDHTTATTATTSTTSTATANLAPAVAPPPAVEPVTTPVVVPAVVPVMPVVSLPIATLAADTCTSPVAHATTVVKPPKPVKRVPVQNTTSPLPLPPPTTTTTAATTAVEQGGAQEERKVETKAEAASTESVDSQPTPPSDVAVVAPLPLVVPLPLPVQEEQHATSVESPLNTEVSPSSADEHLSAELAGVNIGDSDSDGVDSDGVSSGVDCDNGEVGAYNGISGDGYGIEDVDSDYGDLEYDSDAEHYQDNTNNGNTLNTELDNIVVDTDTADGGDGDSGGHDEAADRGITRDSSDSVGGDDKHESLQLPRPPSKLPPPVPLPVSGEKSGASGASGSPVNPFDTDSDEEEHHNTNTTNTTNTATSNNTTTYVPINSTRNAPGEGKIGGGRSMGQWNNTTTTTTTTSATTSNKAPLQFDTAARASPPVGRSIGAWDTPPQPSQPAPPVPASTNTTTTTAVPVVQKVSALPTATPVLPPTHSNSARGGRSIGAWNTTSLPNTTNPNTTTTTSANADTASRGASPNPARQMSPLLAIALSKKSEAEAARGRSPQPGNTYTTPPTTANYAQSAKAPPQTLPSSTSRDSFMPMTGPTAGSSRNSPYRERNEDFDGFDGGRPSDVLGLHYMGVVNGSGSVGGSVGSGNNSPGGSGRDDALSSSYMQRTGQGQVRKRNPRPSEVLTGIEDGMEILNSIALKKLMRVGVKYLPAKEALQRCVITTSAVNHYYNALSLVRTGMLAGLGMDPFGAQLWSPRITSRIKSWLPNLLDKDTKDYHTGYIMLVQYQRLADNQLISWQLTLRYSVFRALNNRISKYIQGTSIDSRVHFPSKVSTFFTGITDKVRTDRMNQLDAWFREILNSALIMTIPEVADAVLEVLEVEARVSD